MVRHWRSSPGVQSRPSTPKIPTLQKSLLSNVSLLTSTLPSPSSPKRQKTLDSLSALPRDTNIKKRAKERENFRCVLIVLVAPSVWNWDGTSLFRPRVAGVT